MEVRDGRLDVRTGHQTPIERDRAACAQHSNDSGLADHPAEPIEAGWMSFDLRDRERSGEPIEGAVAAESLSIRAVLRSHTARPSIYLMGRPDDETSSRQFDQPSLGTPTRARLVYDILSVGALVRDPVGQRTARRNAVPPPRVSKPRCSPWVHRSIDVDPSLLHPRSGDVSIVIQRAVHLDRLQMELSY